MTYRDWKEYPRTLGYCDWILPDDTNCGNDAFWEAHVPELGVVYLCFCPEHKKLLCDLDSKEKR
jgi:hypothetical protein